MEYELVKNQLARESDCGTCLDSSEIRGAIQLVLSGGIRLGSFLLEDPQKLHEEAFLYEYGPSSTDILLNRPSESALILQQE